MTDHPASWLSDPTGRHDHRYWDGTQWTDHVADAGVAASDPYDGPADATPETPGTTAAETTPATSTSGWATTPTDEVEAPAEATAPGPAGWGASTEPSPTEPSPTEPSPAEPSPAEPSPTDAASAEPEPSDLFAPPVSGWGASTTSTPDDTDTDTAAAEPPAAEATSQWSTPSATSSSTPSSWGAGTGGTDTGTADTSDDAPTEVTETQGARWGAAPGPSPVWGDAAASEAPSTLPAPAPDPIDDAEDSDGRGSRKGLVLVLALLAIIAIVVALVLVGDDDDVGDGEAAGFANDIAEQLQEQGPVSDEDAQCVGEYVVDEIGASRLRGVDLRADTAPPELEADFQSAIQDAFTECDVSLRGDAADPGIGGELDQGTDGAASGALTEQQYADYYASALGLSQEKAECLAERSADAITGDEADAAESSAEFTEWLDECGISIEELQRGALTADPDAGIG